MRLSSPLLALVLPVMLSLTLAGNSRAAEIMFPELLCTELECPSIELKVFLAEWVQAWGKGDAETYISYYVTDHSPSAGLSRRQWEASRRSRITADRGIEVELELESMSIDEEGVIDVIFQQKYKSRSYQDVTTKQLYLVRVGDQLRIQREIVLRW